MLEEKYKCRIKTAYTTARMWRDIRWTRGWILMARRPKTFTPQKSFVITASVAGCSGAASATGPPVFMASKPPRRGLPFGTREYFPSSTAFPELIKVWWIVESFLNEQLRSLSRRQYKEMIINIHLLRPPSGGGHVTLPARFIFFLENWVRRNITLNVNKKIMCGQLKAQWPAD